MSNAMNDGQDGKKSAGAKDGGAAGGGEANRGGLLKLKDPN